MKSLRHIIDERKPFSNYGLWGGLHYLFWLVYFSCRFWVIFNVVWRIKPLAHWTQKGNKRKILRGLRKTDGALRIKNERIDKVDHTFKSD